MNSVRNSLLMLGVFSGLTLTLQGMELDHDVNNGATSASPRAVTFESGVPGGVDVTPPLPSSNKNPDIAQTSKPLPDSSASHKKSKDFLNKNMRKALRARWDNVIEYVKANPGRVTFYTVLGLVTTDLFVVAPIRALRDKEFREGSTSRVQIWKNKSLSLALLRKMPGLRSRI